MMKPAIQIFLFYLLTVSSVEASSFYIQADQIMCSPSFIALVEHTQIHDASDTKSMKTGILNLQKGKALSYTQIRRVAHKTLIGKFSKPYIIDSEQAQNYGDVPFITSNTPIINPDTPLSIEKGDSFELLMYEHGGFGYIRILKNSSVLLMTHPDIKFTDIEMQLWAKPEAVENGWILLDTDFKQVYPPEC